MVKKTAAELTKDNPEISARVQEKTIESSEMQTLAQRLMRRAHSDTFFVPLDEGLEIEVYIPTDSEVIELVKLQADVFRVGTEMQAKGSDISAITTGVDVIADSYARLAVLLGKLCVDPSLDYEFFVSGCISASDKGEIIKSILEHVGKGRELAGKFRKNK